MADRTDMEAGGEWHGSTSAETASGRSDWSVSRAAPTPDPRNVGEARRDLDATRRRLSHDLDAIEARIRAAKGDIQERLDLLTPARERIRSDVWKSLALAFGAGLAYALLTAKRDDGRRPFLGNVLRSAMAQLPGALVGGIRAGLGERLQQEWQNRPAAA